MDYLTAGKKDYSLTDATALQLAENLVGGLAHMLVA